MKTTKISRPKRTEQYKLLLRVIDLLKKLCEEPLNNNAQSSRTLIGMQKGASRSRRSELTVPDELVLNDSGGPMPHRPPACRRPGLASLCGHRQASVCLAPATSPFFPLPVRIGRGG